MSELFSQIVNMSISASLLVLAVMLARLLLKKAPKWINAALWAIVALRLVCPFSLETMLSLIPEPVASGELMVKFQETYVDDITIIHDNSQYYEAAVSAGRVPIDDGVGGYYVVTAKDSVSEPATVENTVMPILAVLWLCGIAAMAAYTAVSYLRLRRRVRTAVGMGDNIYRSEHVASPFVLGVIRPRIYLPFAMEETDMTHVIAHERAHIRRRDHWWKPLGFALLTLHWFNPLLWLAYILLCRDIELACDEKVIKELGTDQRADYSQALLSCSVNRARIAACPLAFGEVGVKARVKSVLNYKKPAFWIIVIAVVVCIIVAVCFLTDPIQEGSWGIEDIRVVDPGSGSFALQIPYSYLWGGWGVEMVAEDAPEYTSNGEVPYDGSLGKYRAMISFGDTDRTADFRKKFPVGQVCQLENVPEAFGGSIKVKVTCPDDHGFVIYVGSDVPFTVKAKSHTGEALFGTLSIPLMKTVPARSRLAAGIYIPTECAYMNPLSSYSAITLSEDFRYTVTENSFVTEYFSAAGTSTSAFQVDWQWRTMDEAKRDLAFLEGHAFFDLVVDENCLYQKLGDRLHILRDERAIYLINGGPSPQEMTRLWSIYILVPESEFTGSTPTTPEGEPPQELTLEYVLNLSKKGSAITWEDLEGFPCKDIGSGIYLLQYDMDGDFHLTVSGMGDQPGLSRLHSDTSNEFINIRTDDVMDFLLTQAVSFAKTDFSSVTQVALSDSQSAAVITDPGIIRSICGLLQNVSGSCTGFSNTLGECEYTLTLTFTSGKTLTVWLGYDVFYYGQYNEWQHLRYRLGSIGASVTDALGDILMAGNVETPYPEEQIAALFDSLVADYDPYDQYGFTDTQEYRELVNYGIYTLRYCFSKFLEGEHPEPLDLMMQQTVRRILGNLDEWNDYRSFDTPEEWFRSYCDEVQRMTADVKDNENFAIYHPAKALLLELLEQ